MNPSDQIELSDLITDLINAAFDCGAHDGTAKDYHPLFIKSDAARKALIDWVVQKLDEDAQ